MSLWLSSHLKYSFAGLLVSLQAIVDSTVKFEPATISSSGTCHKPYILKSIFCCKNCVLAWKIVAQIVEVSKSCRGESKELLSEQKIIHLVKQCLVCHAGGRVEKDALHCTKLGIPIVITVLHQWYDNDKMLLNLPIIVKITHQFSNFATNS